MNSVGKNKIKNSSLLFLFTITVLLTLFSLPARSRNLRFGKNLTTSSYDTVPNTTDSSKRLPDSLRVKNDTFNLKISKDTLDAPVNYEAADSMAFDIPNKRIILYAKGKVTYKDIELKADSIIMDQPTDMIIAGPRRDTAGKLTGLPVMVQADTKMQSDLIRYNFKKQQGITRNTYTEQGELHVNLQQSKAISKTEYFGKLARLTTCNLDTPHFAFISSKIKLINQKLAVTGPVHPEFEGVPVPIYIPFGLFPLNQGRHSGLLAPQFSSSQQFGLGLEGLGYYKVLNDYFDVTLRSNLYSYGGFNVYLTPTYRVRYRYNGSLNFAYQQTRILSSDAKNEFTNSKTFNITWSHTVDSRARPGTTFSANVNAGSTKFNQYVANNATRNFSNQLNSSIVYTKAWGSKYNLSLNASHNQNNNTGLVNLSLPNLQFNVNTFYPFQKKEFAGTPKWYEKLGIGLNSNVGNQISFYDSLFNIRRLIDTMQWGAQHVIPIQLSLPPIGPFQIAPGISYQEKWYSRKFQRVWNPNAKKVDTAIQKGLYTSRDMSFSLGINTAIFGTYDRFKKTSRVVAIRHVIRPTFSINYKPDLAAKDYYNVQIDTAGRQYRFSYYEGSMFGAFAEGKFGGISFGVDNNIEMKVRDRKDTVTNGGIKKVKLIDGFGFNGNYNFMADSFQLSQISFYARSTLFEKINITAGATMDPYKVDSLGFRQKEFTWAGNNKSFPRITNGNIAISASFQSKTKDKKKEERVLNNQDVPAQTLQEQQMQLEYMRQNPSEFVDFDVPWNLSLSYSLNFSRVLKSDYSGFRTDIYSNLSVNGDFSLTPKWKVGASCYYDFKTATIQSITTFITREMHCWQLSINVTPVGLYRSFNITVSPKSGLLRDLKLNRTRYFYGN